MWTSTNWSSARPANDERRWDGLSSELLCLSIVDFTGYLFTLGAGRGFRAHSAWGEDSTLLGAHGHGAERPDRDGYVRGHHLIGC